MKRLLVFAMVLMVSASACLAREHDFSGAYNRPVVPDPEVVEVIAPVFAQLSGHASGDIYVPSNYKIIFGDVTTTDVAIQKTSPNTITVKGNLTCTGATCGGAGVNGIVDALSNGFACDGVTDDTAAMTTALQTLYNQGGGTLLIPAGKTCRINGQITLPNDAGVIPVQNPIRITSFGNADMAANGTIPINDGGILDLRNNSATAKIDTRGYGRLEIDHVILTDKGSDCAAFVFTTNTVLHIHHTEFFGTGNALSACNDGIVLGGTGTQTDGSATGWFTGYGTVIDSNFFSKVKRAIFAQNAVNGVQIQNNEISASCGGPNNGAVEFAPTTGSSGAGNYIAGNLIELTNYKYGVWFNGVAGSNVGNMLVGNNLFDASANNTAGYRFEVGNSYNIVIASYNAGTLKFSDASPNTNAYINSDQTFASVIPTTWKFTKAPIPIQTTVVNAQAYDLLNTVTNDEVYQQLTNSANNVTWTWLVSPQGGAAGNLAKITYLNSGVATQFTLGKATDTSADFLAPSQLRVMAGSGQVLWLCGNNSCSDFIDTSQEFQSKGVFSNRGAVCTNGELALSAGWGTTATVTGVVGLSQTCEWTITSSGTGQAANPTITDTLVNSLPTATIVCSMVMVGGTGIATLIDQTTLSNTAPVFTFGGTPVATSTYKVVRRCGP